MSVRFRSILNDSPEVGFREALMRGLAPDGALYVPNHIPKLPPEVLQHLSSFDLHSLSEQICSLFIDEIPSQKLGPLLQKAWNFPIPLVQLDENMYLLELFHGPTLAFKDVGARFMAHMMSAFLEQEEKDVTIVVATSGDTGSAVAHGFHNVPRIRVVVLYPSGKISRLQEQQMTTLGGNIVAVEVNGTFDDCQRMVKRALADEHLARQCNLTTANSINVGRLIPQVCYYVWGVAQLLKLDDRSSYSPTFVVPSGNFGNLTAGFYAKWMGTPIRTFVAATNANDVVPEYLTTGTFHPRVSVRTISNAMDVGDPSNLDRIQFLTGNDVDALRSHLQSLRISDEDTMEEIRYTEAEHAYVLDPHTAVGVRAARDLIGRKLIPSPVIVTSTAHHGKFPEVVSEALGKTYPVPAPLQKALQQPKQSIKIEPEFEVLQSLLSR